MKAENLFTMLRYVTTAAVGLWAHIPELTQLLLIMMAIDTALGIFVAYQRRALSPDEAWQGVTKKIVSLVIVAVAAILNPHVNKIIEIDLVTASSAFYLVPEIGSIIRNAALLGVPVPDQINSVLQYFKSVSSTKEKKQ